MKNRKKDTKGGMMRFPEVQELVGVCRATLWYWEAQGRFPHRIKLGPNSVGWIRAEVEQWLADRAADPARIVHPAHLSKKKSDESAEAA